MSSNFKTILIALAILIRRNSQNRWEVMLQQRREQGPLDKKLEFPGGKIILGETPESASKRELLEETGYQVDNFKLFKIYNYTYSDRRVQLYACVGEFPSDNVVGKKDGLFWYELNEKSPTPVNLIEGSKAIWSDLNQYFAMNAYLR